MNKFVNRLKINKGSIILLAIGGTIVYSAGRIREQMDKKK